MEEQRIKRRRIVVDDSALAGSIGGRIREARHRAGMTQQQLADGRYTKAYISALEKGHAKPSMAALNFIAQRLGLPASRFLADSSGTWDRLSADLALASADWTVAADAYESLLATATDRAARAEVLVGLAEALGKLERGDQAIGARDRGGRNLHGAGSLRRGRAGHLLAIQRAPAGGQSRRGTRRCSRSSTAGFARSRTPTWTCGSGY